MPTDKTATGPRMLGTATRSRTPAGAATTPLPSWRPGSPRTRLRWPADAGRCGVLDGPGGEPDPPAPRDPGGPGRGHDRPEPGETDRPVHQLAGRRAGPGGRAPGAGQGGAPDHRAAAGIAAAGRARGRSGGRGAAPPGGAAE